MLNWLQKLWRSRHPDAEEASTMPPAEVERSQTGDPNPPQPLDAEPASVENREPVLVRGRLWMNTSEIRWDTAQEEEMSPDPSIEELIWGLGQVHRRDVRRSSAESLGQLGSAATQAIPALLAAAVDVEAAVREAAMTALEAIDPAWPKNTEIPEAIPDLIVALKSMFKEVNQAASKLLRVIGEPAVPVLSDELLDGEDKLDQIRLIRVLARINPGGESAVPGLTRALSSQFLHVRIAAAQALVHTGPPPDTAIPVLVAGLSDRSADARRAMATCLARAGPAAEPAMPSLLPLLADPDRGVRQAAAAVLTAIGPPAVPALIELVQARDAQRLKAWAEARNRFLPWCPPSRDDILVIDSWDSWQNLWWTAYDILDERARLEVAQEAALKILAKLGPDSSTAVPAATQALADPNPCIQLAAVRALGKIGPEAKAATPDLVQFLLHSNESFRSAATEALESIDGDWTSDPAVTRVSAVLARQLGSAGELAEIAVNTFAVIGAAAVPVLIDALQSGNRVIQENAARALGRIGAKAQAALPALANTMQHSHPWVKKEAARALSKIEEQVTHTGTGADSAPANGQE
jgi:HEAT repeat protein